MHQQWIRACVGLLVVIGLALHVAGRKIDVVTRLDALAYDMRVRLSMPGGVDERLVILDIDEKSLTELGRWPWGRDKLAQLVDTLFDRYRIDTLGFDVVFAEADESSGIATLTRLARGELQQDPAYQRAFRRLQPQLDHDGRFAAALQGRPTVLGFAFSSGTVSGVLPAPALRQQDFLFPPEGLPAYAAYNGNIARLQAAATSAGHIVPLLEPDGIIRRVPLLIEYQGQYYESLALALLRTVLGGPAIALDYPESDLAAQYKYPPERLLLKAASGDITIPVDAELAALVPYRGYERSFRYVSITDVLHQRLPVEALAGKIVLVGTTAPGLKDQRATPVHGAYPGVEMHANLVMGMLDGKLKHQPGYIAGIELVIVLLLGGIMIFVLPRRSPMFATVVTLLLAAALIGGNLAFWQAGLALPIASPLLLVAILFALNMSWGFFIESRTKRQFAGLFGQYVPPALVDEMARNPESYSMEGRRAELTVLFSDIRGFTTISEGMSPEELASLMNEYLGVMTEVVQRHRGTLDKYIGDAIMAFWGAPVADPQHARHAVLTALDMQQALVPLNASLAARGKPHLAIGVGINTGMMTVGDMGSPVRKAYTVLGDSVNLASRLEGITKTYGVGIVVGEATRAVLHDEFVFRELDRVRVKGKEDPVAIHEPLGQQGSLAPAQLDALRQWQEALCAYRAQEWASAERHIANLQRLSPHPLYDLYAERIRHYRSSPPAADWDGVTTFETK